MKKLLLAAVALSTLSLNAGAATRMTLHEEFTGENCPPCASTNPDFWALCNGSSNPSKLIHISYMVPIPSAGWYCDRTTAIYTSRDSYYSVPFAPYGRYDGHVPDPGCSSGSSAGHPGCFTQADIDAEAAIASPFTIAITTSWDATFSNINTSITITCPGGWSGSGSSPSVKLRTALIKTDDFASPPGSNGETHFENVVQAMYPDVNGTTLPTTWAVGESHTYPLTCAVPTWVDKTQSPYIVAWIQDDNDKSIQQAAKGTPLPSPAVDVAANSATGPTGLICATGTYTVSHTTVIKNTGTSPLTSATVYYQIDGGSWSNVPWSGSLAAGATATVSIPATVTVGGMSDYHIILDSVAMPNGTADVNPANALTGVAFFIQNSTAVALPYSTGFESTDTSFYVVGVSGRVGTYTNSTTPPGHTGTHTLAYELGFLSDNAVSLVVLPENFDLTAPSSTAISYWVAYAQMATTNTDLLEVVYSTDCGGSWNPLSSMTPTATLTASTSTLQIPNAATQYKKYYTTFSGVPAGTTTVGFRCTRHGGNSMWVDDINIKSTVAVTNVNNITADLSVYPNPAKDEANVSFSLNGTSDVSVQIVDNLGRVVNNVTNEKMDAGVHTLTVNTTNLPTGIYNVIVNTNGGMFTEKLSVIK